MIYKIPTLQLMWGIQEIEAEFIENAVNKALETLPLNMEYVEDSQRIDWESIKDNNGLDQNDLIYIDKYLG